MQFFVNDSVTTWSTENTFNKYKQNTFFKNDAAQYFQSSASEENFNTV